MRYPLLRQSHGVQVYFCDPCSPWQKGTVKNNNDRIRRFLPSNTNVAAILDAHLHEICAKMNGTPRKCLKFRTPQEVLLECLQALPDKLHLEQVLQARSFLHASAPPQFSEAGR